MPLESSGNAAYPYFNMANEPFWTLSLRVGVEAPAAKAVSSMEKIQEFYLGAKLDEELYPLLKMQHLRKRLRAVLIETHFAPQVQPLIIELGEINCQACE